MLMVIFSFRSFIPTPFIPAFHPLPPLYLILLGRETYPALLWGRLILSRNFLWLIETLSIVLDIPKSNEIPSEKSIFFKIPQSSLITSHLYYIYIFAKLVVFQNIASHDDFITLFRDFYRVFSNIFSKNRWN